MRHQMLISMITLNVQRNGTIRGISSIAHARALNPYFLFGTECKEENITKLDGYMKTARQWKNPNSHIPEYALRCLLLWIEMGFRPVLSFPEAGLLPDSQSLVMGVIFAIHAEDPTRDLKVDTCSEVMVRFSQWLVASKRLKSADILITDEVDCMGIVTGEPETAEFIL